MADISNPIKPIEIKSSRYDQSVDPSKASGSIIATALNAVSTLGEAALNGFVTATESNIKKDLYTAIDQADKELGLTLSAAEEASIDLPRDITTNMADMSNLREAVNQGKMTETQFYNRMDSVVRQLRVKYPNFRGSIDKISSQVLGFDTANTLRQHQFQEEAAAARSSAARTKDHQDLIENIAKAGGATGIYGDFTEVKRAQALIQQDGYISDPELLSTLRNQLIYAEDLKARTDSVKNSVALQEANDARSTTQIKQLAYTAQASSNQGVINLVIPRGDIKTIEQLRDYYAQDGKLDDKELLILEQETAALLQKANAAKSEFYNTAIPNGSGRTFGTYLKPADNDFDGGAATIQAIRDSIFGKDFTTAKIAELRIKVIKDGDTIGIYTGPKDAAQKARDISALESIVGSSAMIHLASEVQELSNLIAIDFTVAAREGQTAAQVIENGSDKIVGLSSSEITKGVEALKDNVINFMDKNPEEAFKQFKSLFGGMRDGRNMLHVWNIDDRVAIYNRLATPEFSNFIKEKGTNDMKAMYADWLYGSFKAAFELDRSNLARLSEEDIHGYQLSYEAGKGFKLEREKGASGFEVGFSNVVQSVAGFTIGLGEWRKSIDKVNSFMNTFRSALPEDLTPEKEAELLTGMVESLGISTSPSQSGGFWTKASRAISNYVNGTTETMPENTDQQSQMDTGDGVQIQPAGGSVIEKTDPGYRQSTMVKGLADIVSSVEAGSYNTLLGNSQRSQFAGVDITDMTIDELIEFTDPSGAYGTWSKKYKKENNLGDSSLASTPLGRFQVIGTTLKEMKEKMGLSGKEKFDPRMQDKVFMGILKEKGLFDYLEGDMSEKTFLNKVKSTWEGVKKSPEAQKQMLQFTRSLKKNSVGG